jgi:hypothetical protein
VRRLPPGSFDQEPGFSRPELDLQRRAPPENPFRDERAAIPELLVGAGGKSQAVPPVFVLRVPCSVFRGVQARRSDTFFANSDVVAVPPRSGVRIPAANVANSARSI